MAKRSSREEKKRELEPLYNRSETYRTQLRWIRRARWRGWAKPTGYFLKHFWNEQNVTKYRPPRAPYLLQKHFKIYKTIMEPILEIIMFVNMGT